MERKDVFDTQKLENCLKMSKNYKKYGTSHRVKEKIEHNSPKHLTTKDVISEVEIIDSIDPVTANCKKGNRNPIKQHTEICLRITNNQREYSLERKRSSPKNKRKIPSSAE